MTDITDKDKRLALRWCDMLGDSTHHKEAAAARRVILAIVEPPASTLAEELRHIAEHWEEWATDTITSAIRAAADSAEQIEQERDEARAKEKWLELLRSELREERDEARAEVERLTAEVESMKTQKEAADAASEENVVDDDGQAPATLPDHADVKPGEPWLIRVGKREAVGFRDGHSVWPWCVYFSNGEYADLSDSVVTLVSRLVPAPRVITDPDELDKLPEWSIVKTDELDKLGDESILAKFDAHRWLYAQHGLWQGKHRAYKSADVIEHFGPVTILWEAGE